MNKAAVPSRPLNASTAFKCRRGSSANVARASSTSKPCRGVPLRVGNTVRMRPSTVIGHDRVEPDGVDGMEPDEGAGEEPDDGPDDAEPDDGADSVASGAADSCAVLGSRPAASSSRSVCPPARPR